MKIMDGLSLPGWRVEIPNCGRDDFPVFLKEMGYRTGAEIGVRRGEFTEQLCQAGLSMYAVDPWRTYDEFHEPETQTDLTAQFEETKRRLLRYDCKIIKAPSMAAIRDFRDESLDFVYIDGNHSFKYVAQDLCEWTKKVRPGGVVSGHDYRSVRHSDKWHMHVKEVVDAYTKAFGITKWYILGSKAIVEGERRDRWRSWFWIKL